MDFVNVDCAMSSALYCMSAQCVPGTLDTSIKLGISLVNQMLVIGAFLGLLGQKVTKKKNGGIFSML